MNLWQSLQYLSSSRDLTTASLRTRHATTLTTKSRRFPVKMPFMKVNLNGRKYVISGLTEQTSSKNILYSLARADSTFHLETTCTEFSDTSMENDDRTKGTRIKRTRRTRVRRSSTSSVEIVKFDKDCLKGALKNKEILIDLESSEWSEGQGSLKHQQKSLLNLTKINDKTSHVICTECHATHPKKEKCGDYCITKDTNEHCTEGRAKSSDCDETCKSHARCSHTKKMEVKRRKRKSRKRPVSQDVTGWKETKDENNEKSNELGKKGWKSADDVRDPTDTLSSQTQKKKSREEKHKRKQKSKHSHTHKVDNKSRKNDDNTITIIDNQSEYRRVKRHVRKELGDLRIQQMVSRKIDQRFVDFHLACMKSFASTNHQGNEHEIRANLIQLIESQQKCLSALKKAEKQNKKSMSRYSKYLKLEQEKIKFYGIANAGKPNVERTRKMSDTDTGISEMHSDSSAEHTCECESNYVISDADFPQDDVGRTSSLSHFDAITNDDYPAKDFNSKNDVTLEDDGKPNISQKSPNYVVTVDAVAIDDVTHDVQTYVYEKDDDTRSEIIVAEPTGVVPPETTSLVPYRSAESINMSTLSDNSESCFHDSDDVEELKRLLMVEQQKQRDKRRTLDRHYEEIKLMDKRIHEHDKMADILHRLKDLNSGLVESKNTENTDTEQEKIRLEKSIKLSVNLYDYQKSEIGKNSLSLEQVESQVRRKRWHVESALRELERAISSSSRSQLDRIRSVEKLPACLAGLSIGSDLALDGTLV